MKKIILIAFLIFITAINCGAFGKPKKVTCKKPIYFFENQKKDIFFGYLDEIVQHEGYEVEKMQYDLGYMLLKYNIKKDKVVPVSLLLKQFGNDVYLFIDIPKNNTELEHYIYKGLKDKSKNSYLLNNDYFCKQLTQDAESIRTRSKSTLQETQYNPAVYVMDMKRYVGYDKKTYFWKSKYKKQDKKRAQTEVQQAKKEAKIKAKIQKRESKIIPEQL
ncbi:MAG: hypothetical protein K6A44_06270 [bacterium]|nr:hypothetical protein [bacterium]